MLRSVALRAGLRPVAVAFLALALAGCTSQVGPKTIQPGRLAYTQAVAASWDEQILLNLVRLRYRDTPLFLDVGSITTQYQLDASASAAAELSDDGGTSRGAGIGAGISWSEKPTVTYSPLQGEAFVTRMLSPIGPATLVLLSQSGWSVERLLICCVQEINGIPNAIAAAGPTPAYVPDYERFHELAAALRELQVAGLIRVEPDADGNLVFELPRTASEHGPALARARELLGVPPEATELRSVPSRRGRHPDELAVTGRSLLAVLFFLSQAVDVPPGDVAAGLVTETRTAEGAPFDWGAVTDRLLQVHAGEDPPTGAAIAVPYRGHWFWIADDDLTSKSTLNLLSFLFALKAGTPGGAQPLLTLGVD